MRLIAALLIILPLSSAVHLTGYSTSSHFPCTSLSCPEHTSPAKLSSLISSISSSSSHPLLTSHNEPSFTLVIHSSFHVLPSTLLESLAAAAPAHSPTSFTSALDLESPPIARTIEQVEKDISAGEKITHVDLKETEMPKLLQVVKDYATEHQPLVILWESREDAGADEADAADADAAPAEDADKPAEEAADAEKPAEDAADAEKPKDGGEEQAVEENVMQPPEIDASQLVGLLTAAVFLLIFVPGFICLSKIQPPQTFEAFDGTDAKKKIQ